MAIKINAAKAREILSTDTTYRKSLYFITRKGNDYIEINGQWYHCITVDRGQTTKENISNLIKHSSAIYC